MKVKMEHTKSASPGDRSFDSRFRQKGAEEGSGASNEAEREMPERDRMATDVRSVLMQTESAEDFSMQMSEHGCEVYSRNGKFVGVKGKRNTGSHPWASLLRTLRRIGNLRFGSSANRNEDLLVADISKEKEPPLSR